MYLHVCVCACMCLYISTTFIAIYTGLNEFLATFYLISLSAASIRYDTQSKTKHESEIVKPGTSHVLANILIFILTIYAMLHNKITLYELYNIIRT